MKLNFLLVVLFFSSQVNAEFDDKVISPFLGPYINIKDTSRNCPKRLLLTAMCNLGELYLGSVKDPNFMLFKFEGINMGKVEKKINGKLVEVITSKFKDLTVTSKQRVYYKPRKEWYEHMLTMSLKNNQLKLTKIFSVEGQKSKTRLDCDYKVDIEEKKRAETEFQAMMNANKKLKK